MMKISNKILVLGLCSVVAGNCIIPIQGIEPSSPKEEVIYANLNQDGTVDESYVVNIVYPQNNKLIDYGNYSQVKNLSSTDKLVYKNNQVKATTDEEKLSYQGYLEDPSLPWNFKISYYLNGKKIAGNKVAGCKGKITIRIEITENEDVNEVYFNNYALQITASLNSNNCKNIIANGAMIANAGDNKQITYTLLPGNSETLEITSDVTDFEMGGISINGIRLNLAIDKSNINTSLIDNKIGEVQSAVNQLDSGANDLNIGASSLNQGSSDLVNGINQIKTALVTLNQQSDKLTSGSKEVQEALSIIDSTLQKIDIDATKINQLIDSTNQIQTGISTLVASLNSMNQAIEQYKNATGGSISSVYNQSEEMIAKLESLIATDPANSEFYSQLIILLKAGAESEKILEQFNNQLSPDISGNTVINGALMLEENYRLFNQEIINLANELTTILENMDQLKTGISTLAANYGNLNNGCNNYTNALNQIVEGYEQIYTGSLTLANGTSDLYQGTQELVKGTTEFKNQTNDIDSMVDDSISEMLSEFSNDDYQVVSYISSNNSTVYDIQFVITTPAIEKKVEKKQTVKVEKEKSILEKFLEFFGF